MKLNWNHPILVSSHAVTNCTDTLLIGMLLRTIVEKEKSQGTVKKSQQEKVNDVYMDGGRRRGVGPSFYHSVGGGGEAEATSSYSPLRGHHPSINNLRLEPWPLFTLLYGEFLLESRDGSCIETSNQLSFSNVTALHTALSVEKQIPLPAKQGLELLVRLTYWCWNQMADRGVVQKVQETVRRVESWREQHEKLC